MTITDTNILDLMHKRYACKNYRNDKQVSDHELKQILEAGRLAPSSFGLEPWRFLVVDDQNLKDKLFPHVWGAHNSYKGSTRIVMILAKYNMRYDDPYVLDIIENVQGYNGPEAKGRLDRLTKFQTSDFNLLNDKRNLFDWTSKQTYIALAHMMIMATTLDIDSCAIEGFDQDAVNRILAEEKIIDLSEYRVSVMVSFGYRAEPIKPKKRRNITNVVEWR